MCRKPYPGGFGRGSQWLFQFGDTADRIGKIKVGAEGYGGSVGIGWLFLPVLKSFATISADPHSACRRAEALRTLSSRQVARPISFLHKDGLATYRIGFHNSEEVGRGVHAVILDQRPIADVNVPLGEDGDTHDIRAVTG